MTSVLVTPDGRQLNRKQHTEQLHVITAYTNKVKKLQQIQLLQSLHGLVV